MPSRPVAFEQSSLLIYFVTCSGVMNGIVKNVSLGILLLTYWLIFSVFKLGASLSFDSKCSLLRKSMYLISELFLQS